jgi:hypothetical protein
LEDVALARAVKDSGRRIRFRYAATAVRTRMYRNFRQLREGWTKNLALLFPKPGWLAAKSLLLWGLGWGVVFWPWMARLGAELTRGIAILSGLHTSFSWLVDLGRPWWWDTVVVAALFFLVGRLRRANFSWDIEVLGALFGMPMFSYLLLRSKRAHANGSVSWKGRTYSDVAFRSVAKSVSRPSRTGAKSMLASRH